MGWHAHHGQNHEGDAMKKTVKTLAEFETAHGGSKIKALERRLATERAKVEALAETQNRMTIERRQDCTIRFAVTGDRHTGSLYHHAAALHGFYEFAALEGVELVYDCGDILDGHNMYRGQEFALKRNLRGWSRTHRARSERGSLLAIMTPASRTLAACRSAR